MKTRLLHLFICCMSINYAVAQQETTFVEVPPLYIQNRTEEPKTPEHEFGYNFHLSSAGLHNNYYLWVDDQWYEIVNSDEIFIKDIETPLLFEITDLDNTKLKIKDSLDVVYTYPILAISSNFIEQDAFLSKNREELIAQTNELINKYAPQQIEDIVSQDTIATVTDSIAASPVLDVIDITETTIKTVKPFESETTQKSEIILPIEVQTDDELNIEIIDTEDPKPDKPEENRPKNAYEQAVADGFNGTVTEWIEWSINEKKINPYEEAIKNGFEGTEEEWKRSLWGSNVSPEIEEREKTTSIVMKWMEELNSADGYSPYERALKNGFYGTFTEWVESVIGTEGEKAYETDKENGYTGSYKEWIEEKLNASNEEVMRKDRLRNTNFVLVPNVQIDIPEYTDDVAEFDLFDYYQKYYGSSVISSSGQTSGIEIKPTDLEYQITWYDAEAIKIIGLTTEGIIKYQCVSGDAKTSVNIRYIIKNL